MADGLNKVMLLGNLGADPELRVTSGGQSVLKLRLATSESFLDRNKERKDRTEWHSVVVWGKRAEALSRILSKGSRIFVEGALRTTSYEKDGSKRYSTEINANEIILAGGSRGGGSGVGSDDYPVERGGSSKPSGGGGFDDPIYSGAVVDDDIPF